MDASFRPRAGRFGVHTVYVTSEKIGALTSAGTDVFRIPTPFRKCFISRISAQAQVAPVITTGTATATVFKVRGGASTAITAGLDLETLVANVAKPFVNLTTLLDTDRVLLEGDTLRVDSVNGTTVATAPVAMYFVIELLILE